MSNVEHTVPTFEHPGVPFLYDLLVKTLYWPVGGEADLRAAAIAQLRLASGERVLELGCGTGSFTKLLLERGAQVTAVDGSERMLERARRKAPAASFQRADLRELRAPAEPAYDVVFFGFVLHELAREARAELLQAALGCLVPSGRIVIVDHAVPDGGGLARSWRRFLLALEPRSVRDVLRAGYEPELRAVGLSVSERTQLAQGTAMLLTVQPTLERYAADPHGTPHLSS